MDEGAVRKETVVIFMFAGKGGTRYKAEQDALSDAAREGIEGMRVLASAPKGKVWYVTIEGRWKPSR